MASTNLILAVPTADSSVNYDLPANDSAKLSFSPADIDGLKLDADGGLVISFVEGGNVTLNNFQSFIDNGNTLSLADGTEVDPALLFKAVGGKEGAQSDALSDAIKIDVPAENSQQDVTLESGKKYLLNFDLSETQGADIKDGKMIISFANGGKIVVDNYETAMASETPPELSLAAKTCVVTGDELITNIQALAKSGVIEETVEVVEEQETKPKSKIADADMNGNEAIGPGDKTDLGYKVAKVEPAAGDEPTAEQLAQIETAAGGPAGGPRNSGYGIGSRPGSDPFVTNPDIGPIDPTQLGYRAPQLDPSRFIDRDKDGNPMAGNPNAEFIDETNLSTGPISVTDKIAIKFGADGNGGITPNDNFSSSGSKTGGDLSSHGVPIDVSVVGNSYVGMAGGVKVFELVLNKMTGVYTFTQYEQLDHANGSDPNDTITLKFGFTAKDGDGDSVKTSVTVTIADDAPYIEGDEKTIDETNLGPITVGGTLDHDFGQDGAGVVNTTGNFTATGSVLNNALTSSGVAVVVAHTATGYVGTANGETVFTLTIDPQTGEYSYTQFKNLDHANPNDPNDIITLTFGAKIVDYDGDSDTAPIIINIKDDAPTTTCGCGGDGDMKFTNVVETVDETNLTGNVIETGTLVADFGVDVPGSYSFKAGDFQSGGSQKGGALTHNGIPVTVSIINGVYTGTAGGKTIFTLELNQQTGDYKFTLLDNLDHANASDPNDVITLDFGVLASDFEGDSIEGNIRINVKDDAPVAHDDVNTYDTTYGTATGNVVTGLNGGPGAADHLSTDGWTNTDNSNKVVKIAFEGNEIDVPATGTVSIDGENGTLTIAADGTYSYKLFDSNVDHGGGMQEKTFIVGPALPDFDEKEPLDGVEQQSLGIAPGNLGVQAGDVISVKFVAETASYSNSLGVFTVDENGNLKAETMLIKNSDNAPANAVSYTVGANAASVGFFLISNGYNENGRYSGIDFTKGTLDFVYNYGQAGEREANVNDNGENISLVFTSENGTKTVIEGPLHFTSDRGDLDNLNVNDDMRVVSGIPGGDDNTLRIGFEDQPKLGDHDYNDTIFDIQITTGKDCGCGSDDVKDKFTYTLQDGDGDRDTATLTLNGQDLTDDKPVIAAHGAEIVDETNLSGGAITETGKINADFGHDGPGTLSGNNSFTSGGSKLNGALTSGGVAVAVAYANGVYTGKAGNTTVFTMKIESDGSYTFKLFEQLDHADGNDANDIITLNFGVDATDCDGDVTKTNVTVKVKDDAPDAKDDSASVNEGGTVTGNVTNNDISGQDTPAIVTKVVVNGVTYIVPATGDVTVPGQYGTLTIDKTGEFSYTAKGNNPDGTDNFTYTLKDSDGDTDTAQLCIEVNPVDDCPIIVKPAAETVDETDLSGGVITETRTVAANFGSDGPGSFAGNNSFNSSGSKLNGNLTSGGNAVNVTYAGGTYTGVANGVTVFTMKINSDGSYEFKLYEQLDHADGSNPNDIITLNFGVTATDSDGDSDSTVITVNVKDDAPVANDDSRTIEEGQTINGNVTNNDVPGQDVPATVTKVSFGGATHDVPTSGTVTVVGTYGTLKLAADGSYSYTANSNNPDGTDNFTYTLKDRDGDVDTALLCIEVNPNDDCPIIVQPAAEIVDETNLASGTITETGSVTANFGSDGPGSFAGNNSFNSSGSKLNGNLTSGGQAVNVTYAGGTYTGVANGTTVFTMKINSDGSYEFKLYEQLDHEDGNNPNDIINLNFGVRATDSDGDHADTTVTVRVKDDAPVANDDGRATDAGQTITGNVTDNDVVGQDVPGKVIKVVYGSTSYDVPTSGTVTVNGANGTLKIAADGSYTYTAKSSGNGTDNFTYTLQDRDGDTDPAVLCIDVKCAPDDQPIIIKPADEIVDETNLASGVITETGKVTGNFGNDGPGSFAGNNSFNSSGSKLNGNLTSGGQAVNVTYAGGTYTGVANGVTVFTMEIKADGNYTFKLFEQLDHADGSNPNDIINLNFGVRGTDADGDHADTTITVKVKDDAPVANDDGRATEAGQTITGNVTDNDVVGQDIPGKVIKIVYGSTSYDVPETGVATINAANGTLKIAADGSYTYTAKSSGDGLDNFQYTLQDKDGDTDPATLCIDVKCAPDDQPILVKPADEIVDETNLASGIITETGKVTGNFGNDGPGTFSGNNSFNSSGSKLNGNLTSGGQAVNVTYAGGTYTGVANGVTVFTMKINSDGSYEFKLYEQLDHADGNNPNDIINLQFGVKATDADGDSATTTVTVKVKDDAPVANDDGRSTDAGQTITGNVTDNDVVGQDVPGKVIKVVYGSMSYDVPTSGTVTVNGANGTLKIAADGSYTYTAKSSGNGTDNFTYTLQDRDGDTDPAVLCIDVKCAPDDQPIIIKPADEIVDETNLASGVITETGKVTGNFGNDGPGTFSGNNSFTSGGSRLGDKLTSNGEAVVVTYANGVYTGKAGTTTVFTMEIKADGNYTFKLFEQLDHKDGSNPNDIITLDFGVTGTDTDGDKASTTVRVNVKDDAPDARDDGRITDAGDVITGNVTNNDVVGQDVPGKVTKVVYGSTSYDVPTTGTVTVNGAHGTLKIDATGAYTYTAKSSGSGTDSFKYTLVDYDGDSDTATLCVDVKCAPEVDDKPTITSAIEIVDETNLASGVITETGSVTATYGNDGPGSITGNNSFTSGGSRLGDKLTSHGVAVVVTYANGVYTGKAGSATVFTLKVNTNGSYEFKLHEQLDHKDGTNPNDVISLQFGVKATDADGDVATGTITVKVADDAPVAADDYCTLPIAAKQLSSNVLTNDNFGQDGRGSLYSVTVNGVVHVLAAAAVTINTTYGQLTIDSSGSYTYKLTSNVDHNVIENFKMTIVDYDGDKSDSNLQMNIICNPLVGGDGNDTLVGGHGGDIMSGGKGDDWIHGNGGHDELTGREGHDTIYGGAGNDELFGDGMDTDTYTGNDKLYGEDGDDLLYGRNGDDFLDGGIGNDVLYGEAGNDTLIGGAGNDHLIGGAGHDILTGGTGADTFWFMAVNEGIDRITDFKASEGDKLELSNVITNFDPVTDAINNFVFATHVDGNTIISVNNDGTGAAGATQVAVLENVNVNVTDLFNNGNIIT
jgi:T1SS-143 domain-containing protein